MATQTTQTTTNRKPARRILWFRHNGQTIKVHGRIGETVDTAQGPRKISDAFDDGETIFARPASAPRWNDQRQNRPAGRSVSEAFAGESSAKVVKIQSAPGRKHCGDPNCKVMPCGYDRAKTSLAGRLAHYAGCTDGACQTRLANYQARTSRKK